MDQNGDHLPYSDLSHKDLYFAAVSIQNLYLGRYDDDLLNESVPEEGDGLSRIVAEKSAPLDEQFRSDLEATVTAMRAVHDGDALEIALLGNIGSAERANAEAALAAVKQQNVTLEEIANLFGFSLDGGSEGGDETGDGSGTGDGTDTGTETGTDTGTTTSTDTGTDSSDSSDDMGTVFLPNPDMG